MGLWRVDAGGGGGAPPGAHHVHAHARVHASPEVLWKSPKTAMRPDKRWRPHGRSLPVLRGVAAASGSMRVATNGAGCRGEGRAQPQGVPGADSHNIIPVLQLRCHSYMLKVHAPSFKLRPDCRDVSRMDGITVRFLGL